MSKTFSLTEQFITQKFKENDFVSYQGQNWKVLISAKPSPSSGECKTDTYLLLEAKNGDTKEIKISIKQSNADFLENKMTLERARQILGEKAQEIITKSIYEIKEKFEEDYLVTFDKVGRTEAKTLKIGWKFELLNKRSGHKSNILDLTTDQLLDIYSGTNLDDDKRNSIVEGERIPNSGVASHILVTDKLKDFSCDDILENIISITDYVKSKKVYFACKAINYRVTKDKWDGDRPLSVFVEWENKDCVTAKIIFDKPLEVKANEIGRKIQEILLANDIGSDNFNDLEEKLSKNTKYYKD